jgi:hypothetical protein
VPDAAADWLIDAIGQPPASLLAPPNDSDLGKSNG